MNNKMSRSAFDLSHDRKLSCKMGDLVPIYLEEVVPGDYFKCATSLVVRLTPLVAPIMHRVDVFTHFFFVPHRLVWDNFQNFITGGDDGTDATVWPHFNGKTVAAGDLLEFMGLPIAGASVLPDVSALPARGYNLIYNEWYRDQWLQSKIALSKGDGVDSTTPTSLLKRNWEKDYFTGALLSPQKGASVSVPLGSTAPVTRVPNAANGWKAFKAGTNTDGTPTTVLGLKSSSGSRVAESSGAGDSLSFDPDGGLVADLSSATSSTINALRQAVTVQQWLERNARAGSRYVESIFAHFHVRSSDARLQRPEFLGGGRSPIVISEVLQTSETSANSPQGNMSGHGFSVQVSHGFSKAFEEHGYIFGIMSIMPRTAYQQGVPRHWSRVTRYDYPWPEFVSIGEQGILKQELYVANDGENGNVFGYAPRYEELRMRESSVHGLFKVAPGSGGLDFWHMGRIFNTRPTLVSSFVTADPTTRVFAVDDSDTCLVQLMHHVKAVRPIPAQGVPGLKSF